MYTSIPSVNLPSQLPSPSHPLGCYRALIWAPCAIQQLSTGYLFYYGSVYMSIPISQFDPPSPPPPTMSTCPFSMSATLILPCKYYSAIKRNKIGSFEVMWMNLESVIQREVSQKEKNKYHISSVQFSSVAQSCLPLCDPMDCSTPDLPVHHQLLEFTQTHVHWVSDAIQPSLLCRPLLLPPSIFPSIRVFSNESALHIKWPKCWNFSFNISPSNEHSGLISLY